MQYDVVGRFTVMVQHLYHGCPSTGYKIWANAIHISTKQPRVLIRKQTDRVVWMLSEPSKNPLCTTCHADVSSWILYKANFSYPREIFDLARGVSISDSISYDQLTSFRYEAQWLFTSFAVKISTIRFGQNMMVSYYWSRISLCKQSRFHSKYFRFLLLKVGKFYHYKILSLQQILICSKTSKNACHKKICMCWHLPATDGIYTNVTRHKLRGDRR